MTKSLFQISLKGRAKRRVPSASEVGASRRGGNGRKSGVYTQSAASRPRILRPPLYIMATPRCALQ